MRRTRHMFGVMAVVLLALGVLVVRAEPQLAGTWVLDRSQSESPKREGGSAGGQGAQSQPPETKLMVEQQGNSLKVTRTTTMGARGRSTTETYVADGTDHAQPGARGGSIVTRATFDGDRLVVTETHTVKGHQGEQKMSRESVWTLSPDGKVLTIETTMQTPRGDRRMKSVYTRS